MCDRVWDSVFVCVLGCEDVCLLCVGLRVYFYHHLRVHMPVMQRHRVASSAEWDTSFDFTFSIL